MTISIVVATYNGAATIRGTLDSILSQNYQDYEVLLQDGDSQDATVAIAESYLPRFGERLKIESKPDTGIYDGVNKGIRRATGDVVGILNSDDFYSTNTVLSTVAQLFVTHPGVDAVYADLHYVNPEDLTKTVRYYSSRKFRPELIPCGYIPAHPTFYLRRQCYEKYGLYNTDYKVAADFEFFIRLFYVNRINTQYEPQDWVTMRMGGASTSGIKSYLRIIRDHFTAFRRHRIRVNIFPYFWRYVEKLKEFS